MAELAEMYEQMGLSRATAEKLVSTLFTPGRGNVSAGAFPPGWVPPTQS